jgi:hypothetical protein
MEGKTPMYREIRISETPEGVVVDFAPDMFVVPTVEREPTDSNPNIKVDMAVVSGQLSPVKAYYPSGTTSEEIMNKVDVLFEKIRWCPNCERKKRLMLEKLRKMMAEKGRADVFDKLVKDAKAKKAVAVPPPLPPSPPPEKAWAHQQKSSVERAQERAMETQKIALDNAMVAMNDAYVAVRNIFVPPVKPIRPDTWLELVGVRKE